MGINFIKFIHESMILNPMVSFQSSCYLTSNMQYLIQLPFTPFLPFASRTPHYPGFPLTSLTALSQWPLLLFLFASASYCHDTLGLSPSFFCLFYQHLFPGWSQVVTRFWILSMCDDSQKYIGRPDLSPNSWRVYPSTSYQIHLTSNRYLKVNMPKLNF